jgi:hypothetical protein
MDPVLEDCAVLDQVQPPPGTLALCPQLWCGQPDRRHQIPERQLRQDPRIVVVFDRFAQAFEVGADQLGEGDQQGQVEGGKVHQPFGKMVERAVGEAGEIRDRLVCELRDVSAG